MALSRDEVYERVKVALVEKLGADVDRRGVVRNDGYRGQRVLESCAQSTPDIDQ